jgi:hypothetical protein
MSIRLRLLALVCVFLPAAFMAAERGLKAELVGGTVEGCKIKSDVRIDITGADNLSVACHSVELRIPYRKVDVLEYGQNVSRRYAAAVLISPVLLLSKSRKHFVTLGYVDEAGNRQALVLRVDKNDIRGVLSGLEARTGRRVEYQDQQARQSGK